MTPEDSRNQALDSQIESALAACQQLFGQLGQGWAALVAADVVLLGYAVSQKQAWAIAVASVAPILVAYVSKVVFVQCVPLGVAGLRAEATRVGGEEGIIATYLRIRMPAVFVDFEKVASIEEPAERAAEARAISRTRTLAPPGFGSGNAVIVLAFFAHVGCFIVSMTSFHYSFM